MRKSHTFSPHNKVVAGPHSFHQPVEAPPQGGGPAGAAGGGMDASGGPAANFADGGEPHEIKGNSWSGTLEDYGNALKQTASDVGDSIYDRIKSSVPATHTAPGNHVGADGKLKTPAEIADEES
jgi:hypothetical protein